MESRQQDSLREEEVALAIALILAEKIDVPNPLPVIAFLIMGLFPLSISRPLRERLSDGVAQMVLRDAPKPTGKGQAEMVALEKEYAYRAHYALQAQARLTRAAQGVEDGRAERIGRAQAIEARYFDAHKEARDSRMKGARLNDAAAQIYGDVLSWHHGPLTPNDRENHVAAHGHNFRVSDPPKQTFGLPATLPHCKCVPGPPRPSAPMLA